MFDQLKNFAIQKGYDLARKKGMHCPECNAALELPYKIPKGGLSGKVSCRHCDWNGTLTDLMHEKFDGAELSSGELTIHKPIECKVVESMGAEGQTWTIPANRRPNFFWFFSLFWIGITSVVTFGFLLGDRIDADTGQPVSDWVFLFFIPFWLVGIGMLYVAVKGSFLETEILIGKGEVKLKTKLFGRVKIQELDRSQVKRVDLDVAYEQNETPVYRIRIFAKEGKDLKFGTSLKLSDKEWLVRQLGDALGAKQVLFNQSKILDRDSDSVTVNELEEFSVKGVSLSKLSNDGFKIEVEHRYPKFLMLGGLLALAVSVFLVSQGIGLFDSADREFSFFDLISKVMDAVPLIIAVVFFTIALVCIGFGFKFWGVRDQYEFSNDQMTRVRTKGSNRLKSNRYQRESFSGVKRTKSGHVNHDPRYKLTLCGDESVKLCSYVATEVAESIEMWVLHWIQNDALSGYGAAKEL